MVALTLKVETVKWQEPARGAIFTGYVVEDEECSLRLEQVRVPSLVAGNSLVYPGQWWRIAGTEELYQAKKQIVAQDAYMLRPSGAHLIDLLAGDVDRFPGIGAAYARRLYDRLGEQLVALLNKQDAVTIAAAMKDLRFPNAEKLALGMVSGWADFGMGEIISWLDSLPSTEKLGVKLARQLCRCWGSLARQKVEADPFRLIPFVKTERRLKAFQKIDEIAQTVFGVAKDDNRRKHGAIMDSIFTSYDDDDTIIDRDTLLTKLRDRVGSDLAERAIQDDYRSRAFLSNGQYWQARGAYIMEKEVAEMLGRLLGYGQTTLFGEEPLDDDALRRMVAEFEAQKGYPIGEEQFSALRVALYNKVVVITGGAGVGKTTLLRCLSNLISEQGGKIVQMALAGLAARRMVEATGRPAHTIAGFLSCAGRLDDQTTVIIDEASMLCLPHMFQILKKIPPGCRLVLVGDDEQLPPIGPGLILQVLTRDASDLVPICRLTKVFRQSDSTGIPAVAKEIREERWPELPLYSGKGQGVSVIPCSPQEVESTIGRLYAELGGNDSSEDVQILSVTRDASPYGVEGINCSLHDTYAVGRKAVPSFNIELAQWFSTGTFVEGDPVMYTENDWGRDLFNGSMGRIVTAYDPPAGGICARISFDTGEKDMTAPDLGHLELAYSITVHKGQGSQFRRVIIPVKKTKRLDKALLYTAVTRGVEQVVLIGDLDAAKAAVEGGAEANRRKVGLGHMLRLVMKPRLDAVEAMQAEGKRLYSGRGGI